MPSEIGVISLFYNIPEERLKGAIDAVPIDCHAVSGGRAGSTTPGVVRSHLANNPFATGVHKGSERGGLYGPLPMGLYRLTPHEKHHHWVRLNPLDETSMMDRNGMCIHPRGPIGSIGCIVPDTKADVDKILHGVKLCKDKGLPAPILKVIAVSGNLESKLYTV